MNEEAGSKEFSLFSYKWCNLLLSYFPTCTSRTGGQTPECAFNKAMGILANAVSPRLGPRAYRKMRNAK